MKNRIKYLLLETGMSQGELAEKAGITQPYLSQIANNLVPNPGIEKVTAIAHALGRPIEEVFYDEPQDNAKVANG